MSLKKTVFSALVLNHSGVLLRVVGLFSRRGYNIDSLSVCETEDKRYSRMTIVSLGDESTLKQIARQLYKMEDVEKVIVLDLEDASCCELLLVKVAAKRESFSDVLKIAQSVRATVRDIGDASMTLEFTGTTAMTEDFLKALSDYKILEMARTGITALERGDSYIGDERYTD